uniref:Uncharacterized protein n=1 Tax=Pyxicephalus adspersus TaxID=30357 RepID=A0AAV3ALA1_PYXAD|nr:TPA: hypothetical protein GDO54_008914 [Pyxicephalus adspersus]
MKANANVLTRAKYLGINKRFKYLCSYSIRYLQRIMFSLLQGDFHFAFPLECFYRILSNRSRGLMIAVAWKVKWSNVTLHILNTFEFRLKPRIQLTKTLVTQMFR